MKIGDKVRFLHETGGGVVAGFQGNRVLVEDEDGFQIPMLKAEVVVVDNPAEPQQPAQTHARAYIYNKVEQPAEPAKQSHPAAPESTANGKEKVFEKADDMLSVYLAFVPTNRADFFNTRFELYLVNDSNYWLSFSYLGIESKAYTLRLHDTVEPNTQVFIEELGKEDLNQYERIAVQAVAYKQGKPFRLKPAIDVQLRVDTTKFYKLHTFKENPYFEEPALIYTVVENDQIANAIHLDAPKQRQTRPADASHLSSVAESRSSDSYVTRYPHAKHSGNPFLNRRKGDEDALVVDLHASALLDNTNGLESVDILNYQLKTFRQTLKDNAHRKGLKIIFIHGKGEGVLRAAIINELNYRYKRYQHQDASFLEYGYGATQVTIR